MPARRTTGLKVNDIALRLPLKLWGYDHLHFGYWDGLELNVDNMQRAQQQYTEKLASFIPAGVRTILDVGCGGGGFAEFLVERGHAVDCLAPDPELVEHARNRLGDRAEVHVSTFEDFTTERRYDLILMSESCQYIKSWACVERAAALLRPDGYLLICDVFRHRRSPRDKPHISSSGHNLERFLGFAAKEGFVVEEQIDITDHVGPTLDLYQQFLTEKALPVIDSCVEAFQRSHPWWFRFIKLFFGRQARHVRLKYENQSLAVFREYRAYLTLRLRKAAAGSPAQSSPEIRAAV